MSNQKMNNRARENGIAAPGGCKPTGKLAAPYIADYVYVQIWADFFSIIDAREGGFC